MKRVVTGQTAVKQKVFKINTQIILRMNYNKIIKNSQHFKKGGYFEKVNFIYNHNS